MYMRQAEHAVPVLTDQIGLSHQARAVSASPSGRPTARNMLADKPLEGGVIDRVELTRQAGSLLCFETVNDVDYGSDGGQDEPMD